MGSVLRAATCGRQSGAAHEAKNGEQCRLGGVGMQAAMKLDTQCTSEAQKLAQVQLRALVEALKHYSAFEYFGGAAKFDNAELMQQAAAMKSAVEREPGLAHLREAGSYASRHHHRVRCSSSLGGPSLPRHSAFPHRGRHHRCRGLGDCDAQLQG